MCVCVGAGVECDFGGSCIHIMKSDIIKFKKDTFEDFENVICSTFQTLTMSLNSTEKIKCNSSMKV